jgi:PAS domain S-box-containing protein
MASRLAKAGIAIPPAAALLWTFEKASAWLSQSTDFMPHGYCYMWDPRIVWLHVVADGLIALSYYCIAPVLVYLVVRRRRDLPFKWPFWMFGLFILGCGTTHLMEIWTVWRASYVLSGIVKALTAAASVATAVMLIPLLPKAIVLPSPEQLRRSNYELRVQVVERERAEQHLRETLAERERTLAELADRKSAVEELQQVQVALRESQGRLNAIIQSAMDAIITVDEGQHILLFNTAAEEMFRCPAREALGSPLGRFIPERFRAAHVGHHQRFHESGGTRRVMGRLGVLAALRADGTEFPVEIAISQVEAAGKKIFTAIVRDITERKRVEEALQENHARLKKVLEVETVGVMFWDLTTGALVDANDTFLNVMGYSRSDIEAGELTWQKLTPPEYQEMSRAELRKFAATGRVGPYEKEYLHKDGTRQWFVFAGSSLGNNTCVEFCVDISDRKKAEAALRESEDRFRTLIEQASDAFFLHDSDGRFLEVNRQACESLGYTREELLGMRVFDVEQEMDMRKAQQAWEQAEPGKAYTLQGHQRRKDGTVFPVEVRLSACSIDGQKLHLGLARDTTERKHAEESRERLAAIVESSDDAIISKTLDGTINAWNGGAEKVFGYSASEAVGKPMRMLLPPDRIDEESDILARIRRGESIEHFETVRIRKDGKRVDVSVTISPIRDGSGAVVGASKIARDITERKQADQRLRQSEENYRMLFESIDEGFCTVEVLFNENNEPVDYRFLEVNPAFERQTGIQNGRGRRMREIAPQHEEHWFAIYGNVALTGEPARFENPATQLHRWYDVHAFRVGEPQERKVAILFNDVTERKSIEQALRTSEEKLRLAVDGARVGTWHWNLETGELVWSPKCLALFGLPQDTRMKYEVFLGALHPEDRAPAEEAVRKSLAEHSEYEIEFRTVWPDGTEHWVASRGLCYYDANGRAIRMEGIAQDVTERRQALDALRESEERFRLFIEHAPADLAMFDREMRYLHVSRRWRTDYGLGERDLRGISHYEVFPEVPERWKEAHRRGLAGEVLRAENDRFERADSEVQWVRWEIRPWYDRTGGIGGIVIFTEDITERNRAEQALRRSDTTRRFALETAKLGEWELDLTTLQTTCSLLHDQIFGYESLLPDWSFDIFLRHVHPDDRERVRENFQGCASQGKRWEFECRIVWPNGDIRWIWACGDRLQDASGKATRMFGIVQDITERKQAEEVLHEQARVLESAQVFVRDMQSRVVFWPKGAEKLYGFTPQEALGVLSHDLFQTIFPEPLEAVEKRLFETGMWEGELIHTRRDGTVIVVSSAWVLHRNSQGQPIRILETNVDITARKQAEETLASQAEELGRQAEELLRSQQALESQTLMLQSVLDSISEGLVAADETGKFILWNPAAAKILGLGATYLPSQEWRAHYGLFLEDTVTPFPADQLPLVRAVRGETSTTRMFVRDPELDHGVWIEVTGGPLRDKNEVVRGGVAAFRDITQRRADEREIRKLNEELEERVVRRTAQLAAANQELEAFTYSVSHDLRAPLRHIGGFSRILIEDFASGMDPEARHHLQRIEEGTRRMGLLVDELLNLARVGRHALHLQVSSLNSVIEEVVSLLQPEINGRAVTWKIAHLPAVECDPILIKQVFQNLIANALKFTRPRERAVIEISHRQENGQTVILIRDNGVGFNMKYTDKLFGVFQRLHRAEDFEGTGIGLATVQRIIHKHGGRVWAEAELDKGATFYFTLKAAERTEVKPAEVKPTEVTSRTPAAGAQV